MATITARMTARKGNLADLPKLLPGELGLASDEQRVFMGMEPAQGSIDVGNSTSSLWKVEFTAGNTPITEDFIELLNNITYWVTVDPHDSATDTVINGSSITFVDGVAQFDSGTARVPSTTSPYIDKVYFHYNREFGYHAEAFPNPQQQITFTRSGAAGTAETIADGAKEVAFMIENKNSVTLDYTLKCSTGFRHGTLKILIDETGTPINSSIRDDYDLTNVNTTAGSFVIGTEYTILVPGTTDFTLIGAANSTAGTVFTATGVGTGTGTAKSKAVLVDFKLVADSVNNNKWFLQFADNATSAVAHTFTYIQKSFK